MKLIKFIFLCLIVSVFVACNSDDNTEPMVEMMDEEMIEDDDQVVEETDPDPVTIEADFTVDLDAILALPDGDNPDISDLIDFGQPTGTSAADWSVELFEGDNLLLGQPNGLADNEFMMYSNIFFFDTITGAPFDETPYIEVLFGVEGGLEIEDPNFPGFLVVDAIDLLSVGADDDSDIETKYDLLVYFVTETSPGVYDFSQRFTIDPKIQIRRR